VQSETERKQISAMLFSINDAAIAYTSDFEIILVNAVAERLFNLSRQELIGQRITPELSNDPKMGMLTKIIFPSLAPLALKKSTDAYPQKMEIRFFEPKELALEVTTNLVLDDKGKQYGFLKIIKDRSREEVILKVKSDFITVAAHQLRTPLSGLNWALDLLVKKEVGPLNSEQENIVNQANSAIKEMSQSVESLLDASQIEEGRFGYNFESNDLETIIQAVLSEYEPAAKEKQVKLYFYRLDKKLPAFTMDGAKIKMVLETLIDNGIKYNIPNGEVKVKLELLSDKPFIRVKVGDTGIGISDKDINRLFSKFFRSETIMKARTSGLGLGLYIARNIIRRHGGDISVKSIEKRGSTFEFTLPLDPAYIPPQEKYADEIA